MFFLHTPDSNGKRVEAEMETRSFQGHVGIQVALVRIQCRCWIPRV